MILQDWDNQSKFFKKAISKEYKAVLEDMAAKKEIQELIEEGVLIK
jgi:hypothetical protein